MKVIDTRTGREWVPPPVSGWVLVAHDFGPDFELLTRPGWSVAILKNTKTNQVTSIPWEVKK